MNSLFKPKTLAAAVAVLGVLAAPAALAQTASIYGSLGNFDIVNNTGQDACGFEMDVQGVSPAEIPYHFSAQRYGTAKFTATATGTTVRWSDASCHTKTVAHAPGTEFVGSCYSWNTATYDASGCEHFGLSLSVNPGKVTSRWLVPDAAGALVPHDPPMPVVFPSYYIAPPAAANADPVVVAEIEAPEPAEAPELYGPAQWIKIYVRQMPRQVTLEELVTDNPLVVPMDPGQVEINWDVIQAEPASNSNGNRRRSRKQGLSSLDPTTRSVVRRYEFYDYTGAYDPLTNEAICADLTCTAPSVGEIGDFVSAQMAAVSVQGDFLTVKGSGTGKGNIDSSDKIIACGNKCGSPYSAGTNVTLTAKAASGSVFAGWTGACAGTTTTCTVPVNGDMIVGAIFNAQATTPSATKPVLTVKTAGGKGLIVSNTGGINCGKTCSASVTAGTAVALTATPEAGFTFMNWSGACTGTAPTCTVTVNANATAQANFTK